MSNVFIDGDQVHIKGLVDTDVFSVHSRDAAARISADLRASAAADVALCDEIDKALGEAS